MRKDHIDLLDLDRWARDGAPHEWFAELRSDAPVWRHPSPTGGPGFWVVSRYDDVVALGRCPHALSSDADYGGVSGLGPGDELFEVQEGLQQALGTPMGALGADAKMLLTLDPPEHTVYRKIVNKGFTPNHIAALEPTVRTILGDLLDAHPSAEPFDLVVDVSMPLPMRVIGDMLGIPRSEHENLVRWSNWIVASTDPEYGGGIDQFFMAVMGLFQSFEEVRAARAAEPRDDMTSMLVAAEVDGHELSPIRFDMFLFLLALAGNETTRNGMSHAVLALTEHPDQWERLKDDPSLIPLATEEMLRWASPVLYFRRNAIEAMEVGGRSIEPGDIVSLWYVSANRDENHFDRPQEFDVGRDPNHHVAFGGGGPHFCLGASLARLEIRVFLEELVARYDDIAVVGEVERVRGNFLHGIKHMPVTLKARRQAIAG